MRRFLVVPLLLAGFAAAFAIGGNAARNTPAIKAASGTGTIRSLGTDSIVVHSVFDLACKLTSRSPSVIAYAVGDRVKIVCANGVLVRIRPATVHHVATTQTTNTQSGDSPAPDSPAPTTASGVGAITTLTTASIAVTGDRNLTCTVGPESPALGDYHLGDRVKIGCVNGVLYVIARTGDAPPPVSTTTRTTTTTAEASSTTTVGTTTAGGSGTLTGLSSSSVTVTGDRSLTCAVGATSPSTAAFHVGDAVKIGCVNGVLYYIVAATPPPPTTTTTTTESNTGTNAYGFGTISALSATSISVTGDSSLTCAVTADSAALGDYHVGDAVKIGCRNGVLYGIVRNTQTATTTTTTTTTSTTTSTHTYASGTITALGTTSVTVTGASSTLTCAIAPSGPSPLSYGFKVGDHLTIACENGVLTHVSTA
jgi:hypothetical protein